MVQSSHPGVQQKQLSSDRKERTIVVVNRRLDAARSRLRRIETAINHDFASPTRWKREFRRPIPADCVSHDFSIPLRRGTLDWTGYCPRPLGEKLLARLARATLVVEAWEGRRDAVLRPARIRRLARQCPVLATRPRGRRVAVEEMEFWSAIFGEQVRTGWAGTLPLCGPARQTWLAYAAWLDEQSDLVTATAIRAALRPPPQYVGTVAGEVGSLDLADPVTQRLWRESLSRRGKAVPCGPLLAVRCRASDRYKIICQAD